MKANSQDVSTPTIYQESEGDTFTHNGKKYDLNALFIITHLRKVKFINVTELVWILEYTKYKSKKGDIHCTSCKNGNKNWHNRRVVNAAITKPLIVIKEDSKWVVLAGVHRLEKAQLQNTIKLPVIIVKDSDLDNI